MTVSIEELRGPQEKEFESPYGNFRIRKLSTKEVLQLGELKKDDGDASVAKTVSLSLVSPVVKEEEVEALPFDFCQAVIVASTEYNGMNKDKKKLSEIDNTSSV